MLFKVLISAGEVTERALSQLVVHIPQMDSFIVSDSTVGISSL
jgi:hypothetical protein